MASFDELLKAADVAVSQGNLEAAKEIGLMMKQQRMRDQPLPEPVQLGQAGMPAAIKSVAQQAGVGDQRLAGIGSAPMVAGHAIGNLVGADNNAAMQNWKALSQATPDTMGGNIAGNVGMFWAVPAGAVGTGMAMAGRTIPRMGAVADVAATQGGLAAATTPGDASERLWAGMLGAGGGAAPMAVGAVQGGRRMVTREGKQLGLAEALRREVGSDAESLTTALEGRYPGELYGARGTAAMLTRNPTLEVLETGSRVRTPDQWANFDRMNAAARWKALEDAAGTPQELAQLKGARDAITTPKRDAALGDTGGALKVGKGTSYADLTEKLQELATGAQRPNAAVQTMVGYVGNELKKGVTPEQLYTIRKSLTDGIANAPTSELSQAARAARPQRMELIGLIDRTLDDLTGGKWVDYLESYKLSSPLISSREALTKMRDRLSYGRPEGEIPASMGEKPAPYAVGRLLEQHGSKMYGSKEIDKLTPQHRELMSTLLSDLNAQAGVMQPRATLGSPTAGNLANAGRVNQLTNSMVDAAGNVIPVIGGNVAASVKGSMQRVNEEALSELLKDPKKLAEALRKAKVSAELLRQSGQVGAGTGAGVRAGRE